MCVQAPVAHGPASVHVRRMANERPRLEPLLLDTARLAEQVVHAWPQQRRPTPVRPEREIDACIEHVRTHRRALLTAAMPEGIWDQGTPQRTVLRSVDALLSDDASPNRARFVYLARAARRLAEALSWRRDAAAARAYPPSS